MDYVTIYAYPKVWKLENRLYSIMNLRLPTPVEPRQLLYFSVLLAVIALLCKAMPFLNGIPWILRYLAAPFVIANFLLKKKLDGKAPQRYLVSWIGYLGRHGACISRFQSRPSKQPAVKLDWYCARGRARLA